MKRPWTSRSWWRGGEGHCCLVPIRQFLPESYDVSGLPVGYEGAVTQVHEGVGQGHDELVTAVTVWPDYVLQESTDSS